MAIRSENTIESLLAQEGWARSLAWTLVHDHGLAEDLVQSAYRSALSRPLAPDIHPRRWFAAVMRNSARFDTRSRRNRLAAEHGHARDEAAVQAADHSLRVLETQEMLRRAVAALDEPYRSAITARYIEELAPREIARSLQIPVATVRSRIHRGLAMLRRRLDRDNGGDRREWALALATSLARPRSWSARLTESLTNLTAISTLAAAVGSVAVLAWMWPWPSSASEPAYIQGVRLAAPGATTDDALLLAPLPVDDERAQVAAQEPIAPRAARSKESDCRLVTAIEAATLDTDMAVRGGAAYLLGLRGYGESIPAVAKLLTDPEPFLRQRAIEAVGSLGIQYPAYRRLAGESLCTVLRDDARWNRESALYKLTSRHGFSQGEIDALLTYLDDDAADVQAIAAFLTSIEDESELEARVVEFVEQHAGSSMDRLLGSLLESVQDPKHAGVVDKLLESDSASARYQALRAKERLAAPPEAIDEQAELEKQYQAENERAWDAIQRMPWESVPRAQVLERAKRARLVLYGEMHADGGPLREAQMEVLRAFVSHPESEAVGYEPSVEAVQRPVLDLATSLGMRVIPLETNWRELSDAGRHGAREVEAIAAIEAFLAADPSRRMFVVRGESHCLPDGYLVRRLTVKPLILECGASKFVPLCVGGLHCIGSNYKLGGSGDLYVLPYNDNEEVPEVRALEAWLAAHPQLLDR